MESRGHTSTGARERRWGVVISAAVALAWLGMFVHNVADLPGQTVLSPESLFPTLFSAALLGLWFIPKLRFAATWALLAWAALSLIGGGILSVLPIGLLPFTPEQSLSHYLFHGVYAISQVPLICVCIAWLRGRRRR